MVYVWCSMVCVWVYGVCMVNTTNTCPTQSECCVCMVYVWCRYGVCMVCVWVYGVCMVNTTNTCPTQSECCVCTVYVWCMYGVCMVYVWVHGVCMVNTTNTCPTQSECCRCTVYVWCTPTTNTTPHLAREVLLFEVHLYAFSVREVLMLLPHALTHAALEVSHLQVRIQLRV